MTVFSSKLHVFFALRILNVTVYFSPCQALLPGNWKDLADNH